MECRSESFPKLIILKLTLFAIGNFLSMLIIGQMRRLFQKLFSVAGVHSDCIVIATADQMNQLVVSFHADLNYRPKMMTHHSVITSSLRIKKF